MVHNIPQNAFRMKRLLSSGGVRRGPLSLTRLGRSHNSFAGPLLGATVLALCPHRRMSRPIVINPACTKLTGPQRAGIRVSRRSADGDSR